MLNLGPGVQIVLATEPIDLRRGHDVVPTRDGLRTVAEQFTDLHIRCPRKAEKRP